MGKPTVRQNRGAHERLADKQPQRRMTAGAACEGQFAERLQYCDHGKLGGQDTPERSSCQHDPSKPQPYTPSNRPQCQGRQISSPAPARGSFPNTRPVPSSTDEWRRGFLWWE
jgi:hypothetical protein